MAELTRDDLLSPAGGETRAQAGPVGRMALARSLLSHAALIGVGALFGLPFLFLLSTSLKSQDQTFKVPPTLIPEVIVWENYPRALEFIPYGTYLGNTVWIAGWNIAFTLASCTLVAYGFARIRWYGRDTLFTLVMATLMIPYTVILIPQFLLFRQLGWVGTFNPLIIPALGGHPFFIFLLRQFFKSIPFELSEAARIDGASEFTIYWRIILPLSKPALLTVTLFTMLWNWNDFLGPLIYLNREENYTLAVGLYSYFSTRSTTEWGLLLAAATIMITPVLTLFFAAQRRFIQGIAMTGLKG